jgi:hypothetical protein
MEKKIIAYCYDCDKETNQRILYKKRHKVEEISLDKKDKEINVTTRSTYLVIQCLGCDTHSFVEMVSYSNYLDEKGIPFVYVDIYPKSDEFINEEEKGFYLLSEEIKSLPILVRRLYIELIAAFRNDLDILAGIGLRSLIEAICVHKNIAGRNLEVKIENLYKAGYISQMEIPILQKLRKMGNSTVHNIEKLPASVLDKALEVMNHTLKTVYYLPRVDAKIKSKKTIK